MPSAIGFKKIAAGRIGIEYSEYCANLDAGLKWCSYGRHWTNINRFPPDSSRIDGKAQACKPCHVKFHRSLKRKPTKSDREKLKIQAKNKVNNTIRAGKLPKASTIPCSKCGHFGNDKKHQYHHHKGYEEQFHLDVVVLCIRCHCIEERELKGLETFVLKDE